MGVEGQITEKAIEFASTPIGQKVLPTFSIGSGSSVGLGLIEGMGALITLSLGILAGILVVYANLKKGKIEAQNLLKAESETRTAEIEEQIKLLELKKLERSMEDE